LDRRDKALQTLSALKRVYRCQCGRPVFFQNTQCLNCGFALGYEPHSGKLAPLLPAEEGWWKIVPSTGRTVRLYRRCANLTTPAGCNWIFQDKSTAGDTARFCTACRLNRVIPDLLIEENSARWGRIEAAKRRVLSLLVALKLPVASRVSEDPERGLAFDFLVQTAGGPLVMTGHADGVITLDAAEADDATREKVRTDMQEPYRTLVGHFRHELGHYYWYRLVQDTPDLLEGFRKLFGDEREDYAAALKRNYSDGSKPDWPATYVTSYARVHPWEDWAETWAHYLHMIDTAGTAASFGLKQSNFGLIFDRFDTSMLYRPEDPGAVQFLSLLNSWVELTALMNELSRSMGARDLYPFALPRAAVAKLQFIHMVVAGA
jgi:hypothetical protein